MNWFVIMWAVCNCKLLFTNPFNHPNRACVFTGLERDLYKNLYGQHMAQDIVSEAVVNFLQNENPDRPLVLSFHGASGTGKSLVSSMIGRHIYGTAMGSPYIHQFIPTLHFPSADRVQQYRVCAYLLILTQIMSTLIISSWMSTVLWLLFINLFLFCAVRSKTLGREKPHSLCSLNLHLRWDGENASWCDRCFRTTFRPLSCSIPD